MRLRHTILFAIFSLLAACSAPGGEAKLVAAFPHRDRYPGSKGLCAQTGDAGDSCHAYLAVSVWDGSRVADQAEDFTKRYDGYRVDRQRWPGPDGTGYTLVLAVPAQHFDALLRSLRRLGSVEHEIIWSEWSEGYPGAWSRIVLDLQPRKRISITLPEIHWNPVDTFLRALQVSFVIFRTLVDVLIWTLVVAGPFVLLWLGLRALLRRLRT